jgi:hypothetical protein
MMLDRMEEEMAEVEKREREIENGQAKPLSDAEFWREVESDIKRD